MNSHEPMSDAPHPSPLQRWLHEPLVHFLVAGLALFVVYRALNPATTAQQNSHRIELTEGDLRQLDVAWMAQWQRRPTAEERRGLVDNKIREEILYREALAFGLDQGDTIVKRRLAQKMEFLAEDVAALREPEGGELKVWFAQNSARFALPGRVTFRHLYFSPDKQGQQAREAAMQGLEMLTGKPADAPEVAQMADPFMFQNYYGDRTPEQVANVFGGKFAEALFQLQVGAWQGPIESGLGWHLVWIDFVTPGRVPTFEEMEPSVIKSEWIADQRAEAKRKAFAAMQARYEIVLPNASAQAAAGNGVLSAQETR